MSIRVSAAIRSLENVPVWIGAQQITIRGRRQFGASHIVVFPLAVVERKSLFEVSSVFADVADPKRRTRRQLVFNSRMPGLRAAITPIARIPEDHALCASPDRDNALGVDRCLTDEVTRRGPGDESISERWVLIGKDILKPQVERRISPRSLQELRQRHRPEIFTVAATYNQLVGELESSADARAKVVVVRRKETVRHVDLLGSGICQPASRPRAEHGWWNAGQSINLMIAGRHDLKAFKDCIDVRDDHPKIFLAVGRPFVPPRSQSQRQTRSDFPAVAEVKAHLRLPEIEEPAVVLIRQVARQAQQ